MIGMHTYRHLNATSRKMNGKLTIPPATRRLTRVRRGEGGKSGVPAGSPRIPPPLLKCFWSVIPRDDHLTNAP